MSRYCKFETRIEYPNGQSLDPPNSHVRLLRRIQAQFRLHVDQADRLGHCRIQPVARQCRKFLVGNAEDQRVCGHKRKLLRLREPGLHQAHIIVGVEIVQPDDLLFARQQPAA